MTMTLIGTALDYGTTPSSSDDFNLGGADEIALMLDGVTAPAPFGVRLSTDGSTFPATSGDYLVSPWDAAAGTADVAQTHLTLLGNTSGIANRTMAAFLSTLQNSAHPASGYVIGQGSRPSPSDWMGMSHLRTKDASVGPFTHLRMVSPGGNFTAGTFRVYKRTGVLTLIGELDYGVTASASDDFALGGADDVLILTQGISPSGSYGVRLSDDGGLTYHEASGDYVRSTAGHAGVEHSTAATLFRLGELSAASTHGIAQFLGLQEAYPAHMVACNSEALAVPGVQFDRTSPSIIGPFTHLRIIALGGNRTAGKVSVWKWA